MADQTWARTVEAFRAALPEASIVTCGGFLDKLLAIKDEGALRRMRRAAAITDEAHPDVLSRLKLGMTVRDVVLEVDYQLRRHGGGQLVPDRHRLHPAGRLRPRRWSVCWPRATPSPSTTAVAAGYSSDFGRSAFAGEPSDEYRASMRPCWRRRRPAWPP